jgi:hypothetical protein
MNLRELQSKFFKNGRPTPLGWGIITGFVLLYIVLKQVAQANRSAKLEAKDNSVPSVAIKEKASFKREEAKFVLPELPDPKTQVATKSPSQTSPATPPRQYNQSSFGNLNPASKALSDDFLPKGTILYAALTSDIVSNNQVSPATATLIYPTIFAHRLRIPVGTQITGKIAPGNLRGRVFVTWDTLIFYEEGRQGWELPIKGIGMTYEENEHSGRWIINGAGLKGYVFDDSSANAFKLAALKAIQDFTKTLQTFVTTQSTIASGSVITSTGTTPDATLQNSGLAAAEGFIDVIASRYSANLQQQSSYVLVPTARLCAIFLEEPIDIANAAPGRSISKL